MATMQLFDFFKKLFGWAETKPRKRAAASSSIEREFVTPKKLCCNHNSVNNLDQDIILIDEDSDNEDIEVIQENKYSPIGSSTRLNSASSSRESSYKYCTALTSSTPKSPMMCHKFNSGCPSNRKWKPHNVIAECRCPTLTKTHRLMEKNQYEEMLQNFLPHRIHVIQNKTKESRRSPEVIDVIDLEKSSSDSLSTKVQQPSRIQEIPSHSRWSGHSKPKTEEEEEDVFVTPQRKKGKAKQPVFEKSVKPEIIITQPTKRVECVATNTLRDQLAAKAVIRGDFIPQVSKRYNQRIEERYKEAEKLVKMTCVLSKTNRLAREAALEEQLARSMRLCEAVLDEREEPEEPPLPTLTDGMLLEVKRALVPRPPDEVLVEGFGLRITRKDIHTLADLNWLNDEVINFYMNLLIARGGKNNYPKVHAMNTFFYPKLTTGGHSSLKRWTRKVDIFAQDLVVVPVHLNIHWCMAIIDFRDQTIRYYDSMGSNNQKCLVALRKYLEDESLDKKKQSYNTSDWKLECVKDIPPQMNGSDCGVFSCMFAEYICANRKITFTQDDMPYFRNKMVYEILKSKLL